MYKERKLHSELLSHIQKKYVTVVTGMRRTGKTTLVKELLNNIKSKNKIYIDLERIDNRMMFSEENYENIIIVLSSKGIDFKEMAYIAIDEIQLAPNIPSIIKYLYDKYNIKFIITGSSSFYLKNLFTETLAGRKKIFELFPLDFGEFLNFKELHYDKINFRTKKLIDYEYQSLKNHYEEFIRHGGFPEVVMESKMNDKEELLDEILNSYINQDIKVLSDFNTDNEIYNLIKLIAARVGSRIDYSKLANIYGISRYKLVSYFEFFEKTYLINRIAVHTSSPDREIVKAVKLYFCDNGIASRIAQLSSGTYFENAVYNQLKHYGDIKYYSRKNGREIDFILNSNEAFEAKETCEKNEVKRLKLLAENIKIKNIGLISRYPMFNNGNKQEKIIWGGSII